jgi:hypothetical protein
MKLKHRILAILAAAIFLSVLAVIFIAGTWTTFFVYIHPAQMGVVIKKFGMKLDEGQILAKPGERGVQAAVLGEGRHFINPVTVKIEKHPCVLIKPGKIGVVTSKVGKEPPGDRILADDDEKGIWKQVLTPGLHRLNPYGYKVEIRDAVVITPGYVGFVTALLGTPTTNRFAGQGERGLRRDILQPGIYYLNPYEVKVTAVEIGINQVTFAPPLQGDRYARRTISSPQPEAPQQQVAAEQYESQMDRRNIEFYRGSFSSKQKAKAQRIIAENEKMQIRQQGVEVKKAERVDEEKDMRTPDAITFPSSDAFNISLDATIEWELLPRYVPEVMEEFGDVAAIEDKIIIPQSQSIGRLQGSTFKAKDLLLGETREQFQKVFQKSLYEIGKQKHIEIHSAFIRNIILPTELLIPIRQRYIAVEKEQTAKIQEITKQSAAKLQREESLINQRTREVEARTEAITQVIMADQERQVEQIDAEKRKMIAEKQVEIAKLDAKRALTLGQAKADVKRWHGEADAKGYQMKVGALGDPTSYTRYMLAGKLPNTMKVRIVHTGDGTLWTDLEKTAGAVSSGKILKGAKKAE